MVRQEPYGVCGAITLEQGAAFQMHRHSAWRLYNGSPESNLALALVVAASLRPSGRYAMWAQIVAASTPDPETPSCLVDGSVETAKGSSRQR